MNFRTSLFSWWGAGGGGAAFAKTHGEPVFGAELRLTARPRDAMNDVILPSEPRVSAGVWRRAGKLATPSRPGFSITAPDGNTQSWTI